MADVIGQLSPSGTHSIVVADAVTGEVLEGSHPNKELPPASVAKIFTASYALRNLGAQWRFKTQLIASSTVVKQGILQGDLTLVGGGDPALDTNGLAQLLIGLRAQGIKGISGRFMVYGGSLPYQRVLDRDQPDYVGYNPSISGLNLNFNRVFFEWKRKGTDYGITLSAKTSGYKPIIEGIEVKPIERDTPTYKYAQSGGVERWSVARGDLGGGGNRWLPVRDPARYAGEVLQILGKNFEVALPGVQVRKTAPIGHVLAEDHSQALAKTVQSMLKFSNNLMAETIGLTSSIERAAKPRSVADSAAVMSRWLVANYAADSIQMVDHSGLREDSRVSARDMAKVLQGIGWDGGIRGLLKPVELRNQNWKKAPIKGADIVAKTGTLNFTSALSGYMETPRGRQLVFAIFTVDLKQRAKIPKSQRDRAPGAPGWARRSRIMQHQLLARWARMY
ncbi:D-alanyl-D-alanine carboxypeptidase [Amylibacter marinus]|uniref:D-alanyl-D-alanine carboxypeptidase n=1 Tax=Amylibacter marinus TaxID=1475483 RepID=A0ABQ5VRD6_9RHOB|nr:D-alanyl-D-alanine carboxypeptidase/D-alanyl-D-alanine-endopeptidase [Amylibacter marinus]GLQ33817.1 D-alanyl-D-alanine carboxypeptidase [Amylibacter marinus]